MGQTTCGGAEAGGGLALGIVRVTLAAVSEMRPVYFVGDPPGLYHPWGIPLPPISARKYLVFQWYRAWAAL